MNRNRLIQIAALLGMAVSLAGAALLSGPIHGQRQALKLTYNPDTGEAMPWEIAVTQAALGSFRGLAVDFLWYRANDLKEKGQYREANQLSRWICALQPRFQKVWAFHAWNMAYNISVATYTPEERWEWVSKGIRLLREDGLRANPGSVIIHKELGWIFSHKIGAMSDDMHWYYRTKLAEEWQMVLGSPEGLTTEQAVARMQAIVDAPDDIETLRGDEEASQLLAELRGLGYAPDVKLLRAIGRVAMFRYAAAADVRGRSADAESIRFDPRLAAMDPEPRRPGPYDAGFRRLVPFLRKQVLIHEYNMDPAAMLGMMQTYGPIDWRHPSAHGAYWSEQGIRAAVDARNKKDIDQLNTDRQVIHAMQALTGSGRIIYDPVNRDIDLLPDPRFIKAYEAALEAARERVASEEWASGARDSYAAGYENFLLRAMVVSYLYGEESQARGYHLKWRERFRDKRMHDDMWRMPLRQLVLEELTDTSGLFDSRRQFIDMLIRRAFLEGVCNGRADIYTRFMSLAEEAHRRHQESKTNTEIAERDRMRLPPFPTMVIQTYVSLMVDARIPLARRSRLWRRTALTVRQAVYDQLLPRISDDAKRAGYDPARVLPEPPGMAEFREALADRKAAADGEGRPRDEAVQTPPETIERR